MKICARYTHILSVSLRMLPTDSVTIQINSIQHIQASFKQDPQTKITNFKHQHVCQYNRSLFLLYFSLVLFGGSLFVWCSIRETLRSQALTQAFKDVEEDLEAKNRRAEV